MAESVTSCFERYEKKYRITKAQQRCIIEKMKPYMQADKFGKYTICNIYYDTRDWRLIRSSIEKPAYKEKLRVRSYGTPDADGKVFVEVKKKYDGIVYKRRITMPARQTRQFLSGGSAAGYGQIGREIGWLSSFYGAEPKVFIAYDRLAFAGTDDPELRITFDTDLRWRDTALEIGVLFMAMAIGLATGMGYIGLAVMSFLLISALITLLTRLNFGAAPAAERTLKITIPENLDYEGLFDDLFESYTSSHSLIKVKTSNMGTLYELEYCVVFKCAGVPKEFLDALRCRNGNLNIVCSREISREAL